MLVQDDSALRHSIHAKAIEISLLQPCTRLNPDASTRGIFPGFVKVRYLSALRFGGLDSFAGI